jgi:hypothetical protein
LPPELEYLPFVPVDLICVIVPCPQARRQILTFGFYIGLDSGKHGRRRMELPYLSSARSYQVAALPVSPTQVIGPIKPVAPFVSFMPGVGSI